jgi:endoglucanase
MLCLLVAGAGVGLSQSPGPQKNWPLWNSYAAHFIDQQGRVIDYQGGARTTSEGQSYALFFALAANDRARFDLLLRWTQANLAHGDLGAYLPAWLWGKNPGGEWKILDPNSASDADLWMAYTLVEAGRLWKSSDYTKLGRRMMIQIAGKEVVNLPGFGPMLLPGSAGFQHGRNWTLNPSYLSPFIFLRLAVIDPVGPWRKIARGIPRLLQESARGGFAMDWVEYSPGKSFHPTFAHPNPAHSGKDVEVPVGSYDAIRVYLWVGMMDGSGKLRAGLLGALPGMRGYLANHNAPPEKISDRGIPLAQDGPVGFSAALLPYLMAFPQMNKQVAIGLRRLSDQRDAASGLYGKGQAYYDQNLALFGTGFTDNRFRFGASGKLKVEWTRG